MELKLNLNWLFIHVEGLFEGVASSPSPRDVTDAGLTYKWPLSFQGDTIKSSRTWPEITTNAFEMGQATYAQKGCRNRRFGWSIFAVSQCKQGGEKRRGASRHRGVPVTGQLGKRSRSLSGAFQSRDRLGPLVSFRSHPLCLSGQGAARASRHHKRSNDSTSGWAFKIHH